MATSISCRAAIGAAALAVAIGVAAPPALAQEAPAADLYVPPGIGVHTWVGQATHDVAANVVNFGDLAAEDVALTLSVSAGWTVTVPTEPDPPGRSCAVAPDARSVTCTFDEIGPGGDVGSYLAPVTSPPGPSSPAAVTVSATSPTPDLGEWPNSATDTLPHQGGSISVAPSTGLVHGQTVQVTLDGASASTGYGVALCDTTDPGSLSDCDLSTVVITTTDADGDASFPMPVRRYISTNDGLLDCAVDTCRIGLAAVSNLVPAGAFPVSFAPGPAPSNGIGVTLTGQGYLSADPTGEATVSAELTCTTAGDVDVEVRIYQPIDAFGPVQRETSTITVPCTPGDPVAITSDLLGIAVRPSPATILVHATSGGDDGWAYDTVDIQSNADARQGWQDRFDDPDDTTAVDDFIAALLFRISYNPEFAQDFWRAVLQAVAT